MIEKFINYINDKNKAYVIFDIGSRDCQKSIEFYKTFPNAKIYAFECNPNTLDLCEQNIIPYQDRITLIKGAVCDYDGDIEICYINNNDFKFIENKIALNRVKLLVNSSKILFNNLNSNLEMFCVYHKKYYFREDNFYFTFFGVNEAYSKEKNCNNVLEYELDNYNPFLQKRGYMETSVYLHVYWNKLYENKDMVGFSQYDMKHSQKYDNLDNKTIYLLNTNKPIVKNGKWEATMFPKICNLDFLIKSYNAHFDKKYTMKELENKPFSLWQTNIYPVATYEKLCEWLKKLVDEIYPWSNQPPYQTHFGSIGGYTERALSIFNAFEIHEGTPYSNLNIQHGVGSEVKEQYNHKSFLNNYSQDVHTKYVNNITGILNSDNLYFKSQCYLDNICYSCERNLSQSYLILNSNIYNNKIVGKDIEANDSRLFIYNNQVFIMLTCRSPYPNQLWCIAITLSTKWNPIFLQIKNMKHNLFEKNWSPFVKNNKLFFVYNYDPLIIINYDFNDKGLCNVVFKQNDVILPFDISNKYLRGGSNLLHYKNNYYIGTAHSRVHTEKTVFNYTHIILLDTEKWKLVYVSKPVMYNYSNKNNNKFLNTYNTILVDIGSMWGPKKHIHQWSGCIYENNNKYFITVNIRENVTLLYEIQFKNILDLKDDSLKEIGYWDNLTRIYSSK